MPLLSKPSGAFPTSLVYITIGILTVIWTLLTLFLYQPESQLGRFLTYGFLASGFALTVIGFFLGRIGRAARNAELPPAEITAVSAQVDQNAAARAPIIAPIGQPMQNGMAGGAVVSAPAVPQAPGYNNPAGNPGIVNPDNPLRR